MILRTLRHQTDVLQHNLSKILGKSNNLNHTTNSIYQAVKSPHWLHPTDRQTVETHNFI